MNAELLPEPPWSLFSVGDWRSGTSLVMSAERPWPGRRPSPGTTGINRWPVGAVAPALIETEA